MRASPPPPIIGCPSSRRSGGKRCRSRTRQIRSHGPCVGEVGDALRTACARCACALPRSGSTCGRRSHRARSRSPSHSRFTVSSPFSEISPSEVESTPAQPEEVPVVVLRHARLQGDVDAEVGPAVGCPQAAATNEVAGKVLDLDGDGCVAGSASCGARPSGPSRARLFSQIWIQALLRVVAERQPGRVGDRERGAGELVVEMDRRRP